MLKDRVSLTDLKQYRPDIIPGNSLAARVGTLNRHPTRNVTRNVEDSCVDIMSLILIVACCDVHSILQMLLLMGERL